MTNKFVAWGDINTPPGYSLSDRGLGYETKTKMFQIVAPPLALIRGSASLETNNQTYTLQYLSPGNVVKMREVEAASLTSRDIESWVSFGIGITPANKTILIQYLVEQRMLIPMETVYEGVGWLSDDCFGTDRMISLGQQVGHLNSETFNLKPKGSKSEWLSLWQSIGDSLPLQLALAIGLTAPLLKPLSEKFPDLSTLIFSVVGDSSSGKSTMLAFCLSLAGETQPMRKGSLFQSWSGTAVALSLRLNGDQGIPVGLDELSRYHGRDITEVLYNLSAGTEKARGTKQSTLRKQATWQTTIISTGEHGLLDDAGAAENQGLRMRVIELSNVPWTRSSAEAEQIKLICASNYGWLYPDFVRNILTKLDDIKDVFTDQVACVKQMIPESDYRDRISVPFAVVRTAALLANVTWPEVNIDVDGILKLLITHSTATWSTDLGDRIYGKLLDYLKTNQKSLMLEGHSKVAPYRVIGTISMNEDPQRMYINIYKAEFTRIVMDELNAQSSRVVLAALKKKQLLRSESGRSTIRQGQGKKRQTFVSILVPQDEERDFTQRRYFDLDDVDETFGYSSNDYVRDVEETNQANHDVYPQNFVSDYPSEAGDKGSGGQIPDEVREEMANQVEQAKKEQKDETKKS